MIKMKCVTIALVALCVLSSGAVLQARASISLISEKQEIESGKQADAQITKKYHISTNRRYNNLVNYLGKRLARASDRPDLPWTFRVIDAKDVNAFSVPSYVYVNTGLINLNGKDQDALAGVIAHEIGHTCGKHAVKQMEKSYIGGILGALIGGRNRGVGALVNVAQNMVMLGYSRDDENDADKRAVKYTLAAGYDPEGLVRFFKKLEATEGNGGGGITTYFKTHPPTPDRVNRVEQEIRRQRQDQR